MIANWRVLWEATENGHRKNGISTSSLHNIADCHTRMKQIMKQRPTFIFTSCTAIDPDGKQHTIDLNSL